LREVAARPASRSEFERALIELIAVGLSSRRRTPARLPVELRTPLFESGLIDSLAILELIAFVEEATGRTIHPRAVHLKHFGTVERISAAFWPDERGVDHVAR
jgi:acyl carrier protein